MGGGGGGGGGQPAIGGAGAPLSIFASLSFSFWSYKEEVSDQFSLTSYRKCASNF
jgi:hypothetical protein